MSIHNFQFFTLETIIVQTLLLAMILWVLYKFVFKPYLKYLDEESEKRQKLEQDYIKIEHLNNEAQSKREELLSEARAEAKRLQDDALHIARQEAQQIVEKAENDAVNIKNQALGDITKERESLASEVKKWAIDLILKFNAKLFGDAKIAKDFVETEISSIK